MDTETLGGPAHRNQIVRNRKPIDPNGKRVEPNKSAEILWRFTKAGTFEFACLIPGHYETGMKGTVIAK